MTTPTALPGTTLPGTTTLPDLLPHHSATLTAALAHFTPSPSVLAVLLVGSIAHGLAAPTSDVDLLVLLTEPAFAERREKQQLTFVSTDLATYAGGFIDAKYVSLGFLREVAERGSEPARWALQGARVVFSRLEEGVVEGVVEQVVRYPEEGRGERVGRFRAQVAAWRWFCGEGRKRGDKYVVGLAVRKMVLFGGRLVLVRRGVLYPFHKWFLRVLGDVPDKPAGLMESIDKVLADPSEENVDGFYEIIKNFDPEGWEEDTRRWGMQFMLDNELTWMSGHTPVDDL